MKKAVTSNCEQDFVYQNISNNRRLDRRKPHDGRDLKIVFGKEDGCCGVSLGETRVLASVKCEIITPKAHRPSEGSLDINIELSPMADPNFRSGYMTDDAVEASRLLERNIRDSKCIDVESLCIVSGEKAWAIKVTIQVLNNDGNIIGCSSIACIAALAHFKKPAVTVDGTDVIVHTREDRNPVPLTLHHMPIIVNLSIYDEGKYVLVDPVEKEERISSGKVIIGVNAHQELCLLHLGGVLLLSKETIVQCTNIAVQRAQIVTKVIRSALDDDQYQKSMKQPTGFATLLRTGTLFGTKLVIPRFEVHEIDTEATKMTMEVNIESDGEVHDRNSADVYTPLVKERVRKFLKNSEVAVFEGGASQWQLEEDDDDNNDEESSESETERKLTVKQEKRDQVITVADSDNSEEDTKDFLKSNQVDIKDENSATTRGWYSRNAFL